MACFDPRMSSQLGCGVGALQTDAGKNAEIKTASLL